MKDSELVDKAIEKATSLQKNETELDMITVPFLEGLAKKELLGYDQVFDEDGSLTKANQITVNFLGFKSFKDMYLLARHNDNPNKGVGTQATVKYFDKDIDLVIPEDAVATKSTMDNSLRTPDGTDGDNKGDTPVQAYQEVRSPWKVTYTGTDTTNPSVTSSFNKATWSIEKGSIKGQSYQLLYTSNGEPKGVAQLKKLESNGDSPELIGLFLAGYGSNEDIQLKVIGDLTIIAIKQELQVVVDASQFDDTVIPYLVALGYTKGEDTMYVYAGKGFPEELKVVIDNGF